MNKQNLGYRVGKLYRKFRQWQHPTLLKWVYVLITAGIVLPIFWELFVWVFIIAFGVMVATVRNHHNYPVGNIVEEDDESDCVKWGDWKFGNSGYGFYVNGFRVDDDD